MSVRIRTVGMRVPCIRSARLQGKHPPEIPTQRHRAPLGLNALQSSQEKLPPAYTPGPTWLSRIRCDYSFSRPGADYLDIYDYIRYKR